MPRRSPKEGLSPRSPEDLFVTSLSVQGGETIIDREKTAFVRILLAGLRLENMTAANERRPVRQVTVLNLEVAEDLLTGLREIMNGWARSSRTPVLPARGVWSWMSGPLPGDDILVTKAMVAGEEIHRAGQVTPIIRLDFRGKLLKDAASTHLPPSRMPGAIFSVPRHVQALISSLKKCILTLRPQTDLQYIGFAIPSLEPPAWGSLQASGPQPQE